MLHIFLLSFAVASADKMEPFIVGGNEASISDWPFMVYIEISEFSFYAAACGGSLISSQTVLTAAHCLDDFNEKRALDGITFKVYMGHSRHARAIMIRGVLDYETPKQYSPDDDDVRADIGIMFLMRPVIFIANVQKAILQRSFNIYEDRNLVVAGWGRTKPGDKGSSSWTLKEVKMQPDSYRKCRDLYRVICARNYREYPYSGDSGGPVVNTVTRYQVGIVSVRDVETGLTILTSVPEYWEWIRWTQFKLFRKYCDMRK
ncbi:chymotrypsin-1-like [Cydia pomonella]|uniref:chymotrypsin-1-like n=1 Tax=Cydia pomonella TaxID=82600 RepID=UPI002ADD9969|nr:chymotrypsin-1-like [Cydia pomonella]